MSIFKNFFRSKSNKKSEETRNENTSKYMPKIKLPIDESFTINFKSNGGKFLYCENLEEVFENVNHIFEENNFIKVDVNDNENENEMENKLEENKEEQQKEKTGVFDHQIEDSCHIL